MAHKGTNLFRVVYGSIYLLLYIVLLGLLLITPADAIERSLRNGQHYNVWLLIFAYVATILVVCFIYFVRLYVNRTDLAAIPKAWIPIEPGDVKKRVHAMIATGLDRSAAISYEARPREERNLVPDPVEVHDLGISRPLQEAIWRGIEHYGWAPPTSPDLPNLNYSTVLSELPHLIEGKVLTLAPRLGQDELHPDDDTDNDAPVVDPEAVSLLQRTPGLSLRGYIDHLQGLGVLPPAGANDDTVAFLLQYEHARFSKRAISNAQFRELMHLFAAVLRAMQPLSLATALRSSKSTASSLSEYSGSGASLDQGSSSVAPRSSRPLSPSATVSTQDSIRRPLRSTSWAQSYRTAPNTPRSRRVGSHRSTGDDDDDASSGHSFAQTRRQFVPSASSSGRSLRSQGSSSVIRLSTRDDEEEGGMPYVLNLSGTTESLNATPA
jgi:hypothetical protein